MELYRGVEVQLHALTSAVDEGERSASCPTYFTHGERAPSISSYKKKLKNIVLATALQTNDTSVLKQ
jgi:hypothetical protein